MYNLLLVDDEPLIKVAFQSAVEWGKNGFLLAATASNGQEALHIVETQHIDAVITDLKMPGMDGLALIHELKKRSFTGHTVTRLGSKTSLSILRIIFSVCLIGPFFLQFVSTKVTLILLIMFVAFLYLLNNSSTIDSKPSLNFAFLLLIP